MTVERQHYVPQGFLKGFTIEDEVSDKFIWVYQKLKDQKPRKLSVKSVAWEPHYYQQETPEGEKDLDSVERKLAETVDNVVPDIIRGLNPIIGQTIELTEEHKGILAFFIGLTFTRVPSFREPITKFHAKIAQRGLEEVAGQNKQMKEALEKYGVKAVAKDWASLRPMISIAEKIGASSLTKTWEFFVPPDKFSLVTSDNPAIFSVADKYGKIPAGPGHPLSELVINLRKDLALVCTPHSNSEKMVFAMTKQDGKKFNRGIVRAARRYVFSSQESEVMDKFVKKYIGKEQTIIF